MGVRQHFVLVCILICLPVDGFNILLYVNNPTLKSHFAYVTAVAPSLMKRGHEAYSIIHKDSGLAEQAIVLGIKPIFYGKDNEYGIMKKRHDENLFLSIFEKQDSRVNVNDVSQVGFDSCENIMRNKTLMDEIKNIGFDLVIYDSFTLAPCAALLPAYLNISSIGVSSAPNMWSNRNPMLPSFYPHPRTVRTNVMTFFQRLENLVNFAKSATEYSMPEPCKNTSMLTRYIPESNIKSWDELLRQSDLRFISRDEILEWPFPVMPHIVKIACITCRLPKRLPLEIETFMNSNPRGVILVTFGSAMANIPDNIFHNFLTAFRQVKQHVLLSYKGNNLPMESLPAHIKVLPWLPQNDILGHPQTKLFITHCGNNGQYESLYHGVPMIGLPAFAEQSHNALRMTAKQYGIHLNLKTFTSQQLLSAIETIIGSNVESVYTKNAKLASRKLKSRPLSAQDKAAYWAEHIIKYGSKHLRSHALNMSLTEFLMLDLLLFGIIAALCILCLLFMCCYLCSMYLCRR